MLGQAEENHAGHSEIGDLAAFLDNLIGRLLKDAGHGAHFDADILSRAGEHGIDEAGG